MDGLVFTCKIGDQPDRTFAVASFQVDEALSQLFNVNLLLVSSNPNIALRQQLMQKASLTVTVDGIEQRTISGRIASFEQGKTGNHSTHYRVIIRPELWALTLTQDSRIFHFKTVPQIISELMAKHHIVCNTRYLDKHEVREFVTQKRETDYDFFCRLAAEEGIAFWVTKDGLMCSDSHLGMTAGIDTVYHPQPEVTTGDIISQVSLQENMRPNEVVHKDRISRNPDYAMVHKARPLEENEGESYSMFDSYGRFQDDGPGKSFTQYRLEQQLSDTTLGTATSNCFKLTPGKIFTIANHPAQKMNARWQVLCISHSGHCPDALEEVSSASGTTLTNELTFIPGTIDWRPPCRYKPLADGDEVATVVGPENEEIYVNEDGAIRVHFHWNRYDKDDDRASCWVNVAQAWNGDGYGFLATPRIGQEVIVSYLNGDVDRPIVTGTTYNGLNRPPLDLPADKTRTTLKTRTHKGEGFNELRFEDAKGKQEVFIHAQKDMNTKVLDNRSTDVGTDHTETIGRHQTIEVEENQTQTIHGNQKETIDGNQVLLVKQNQAETVLIAKAETIGAAKALAIGAAYQVSVGASKNETVSLTSTEEVGILRKIVVGKRFEIICGETKFAMNSNGKIILTGKNILIEGAKHVEIDGKKVEIN